MHYLGPEAGIGSDAELAGDVGGVKRCRQLSRSSVSPAEHVGEHHAGRLGCRAACGSGGITGGVTTAGGADGGDEHALALSSSTSSVGKCARGETLGFIGGFLLRRGAALFLEAVSLAGGQRGALAVLAVLRAPGLLLRQVGAQA